MGMDISSEQGFILTFSHFLGLFRPEHLYGVQRNAIRLIHQRLNDGVMESEPQLRSQIHNIQSAKTIEECTETLAAIVKDRMLTDREEWDVNDNMDDIGMVVIDCISRVVLPLTPTCMRVFASQRISGWHVPIEEPVLIFEFRDLFETHMTAGGLALARAIGESKISPIVWTNMSV